MELTVDHKVDVLLSLMASFRSQIMTWHERAYLATTASFGLLLLLTKYWLDAPNKTYVDLMIHVLAVVSFALLTQLYLQAVTNAYRGNEHGKLKCEYALKLKHEDEFFRNAKFFWAESDPQNEQGMPAGDLQTLRVAHGVGAALLVAVLFLSFFRAV